MSEEDQPWYSLPIAINFAAAVVTLAAAAAFGGVRRAATSPYALGLVVVLIVVAWLLRRRWTPGARALRTFVVLYLIVLVPSLLIGGEPVESADGVDASAATRPSSTNAMLGGSPAFGAEVVPEIAAPTPAPFEPCAGRPSSGDALVVLSVGGSSPSISVLGNTDPSVQAPSGALAAASSDYVAVIDVDRRTVVLYEGATWQLVASKEVDGELLSASPSDAGLVALAIRSGSNTMIDIWDWSTGRLETVIDPSADLTDVAISSDGGRLAWTEGGLTSPRVMVADVANPVAELAASESAQPAWSPGGERLVVSTRFNDTWAIAELHLDDQELKRLTNPGSGRDGLPAWSPTCDELAFVRTEGDSHTVLRLVGNGTPSEVQRFQGLPVALTFVIES